MPITPATAEKNSPDSDWFTGFEEADFEVNGSTIHARFESRVDASDQREPLLLLHGFPQSHVMWHRVAKRLRQRFILVMPDLRGYGESAKPAGQPDHSNYSKRSMAQDLSELMELLGFEQFFLAGHDRGARVAHRLALDHPSQVKKLCVIDIAPTLDMYAGASMTAPYMEFARSYYHWFHMLQPSPLPETMMGAADPVTATVYLHAKLGGWGSTGLGYIEPRALAEYELRFCNPQALHAACEDYRASAGIDLEHDRQTRLQGQKIHCDTLLLWGERGVVNRLFDPMALWRAQCAGQLSGQMLAAGHFLPEELPDQTAELLAQFFTASR